MEIINNFLKKNYQKILIVVGMIFLVLFLSSFYQKNSTESIKYVQIAGQKIKVDLAITPSDQEKGLSDREKLEKSKGMLFIFNYPDKYSFWMKDMNFPIDIIWINKNLEVVYIQKNVDPNSYPRAFQPNQEALYVLEVSASFSKENNLKIGEKIKFLSS